MAVCFLLFNQLKQSLTPRQGQLQLRQLAESVTIHFDKQGTPTVNAQNDADAFFAQGYLHASERMWQMELQRRLVQGRLSELFGTRSVPSDVWMRTLGLAKAAKIQWANLSQPAKQALDAYAKGVNSWIDSAKDHGPEFALFGITPKPWQPVDSLAWQKVLALNLGQNMYDEVARRSALKILNGEQLKVFFPYDPDLSNQTITAGHQGLNETTQASGPTLEKFAQWQDIQGYFRRTWGLGERFAGSNAWVVAGKHTASGFPMLANDPHLGLQIPSVWYAISLYGDKLAASGMSLVGLPGVMLGRNRQISWGVTNLMGDTQDLFILDIPLENNQVYLTDTGPKAITSRRETIEIAPPSPQFLNKKVLPITIEVRETELGPIVSDVVATADEVMALRWSALDEKDTSFEAFFKAQYATNWQEFRQAVSQLRAPGMQFIYADKQGNIGSQVAGYMAKRGQGEGILPQRAFNTSAYWQGYSEFDRLPRQFNPPQGYIVSANTVIDSDDDVILSHEWANPYRKHRIEQMISDQIGNNHKITLADMQQMQIDYLDLGAKVLLPLLADNSLKPKILAAIDDDRDIAELALTRLSQWQGSFDGQSVGASIYHYWLVELKQQIFVDELNPVWQSGPSAVAGLASTVTPHTLKTQLTMQQSPWCGSRHCHDELIESFKNAIVALKKDSGSSDPADWRWGLLHHAEYGHQPFGGVKLLDKVFKTTIEVGGSADSVNASGSQKDPSGGYRQSLGATFRQIFDLAQDQGGAYILATGQSGMFMSSHYDDMIVPFVQGKLFHYQVDGKDTSQTPALQLLPEGQSR